MSDFYYALYAGKTPMVDDYGNKTGEYEVSYENPVPLKANISAARGETISRQFGEDVSYDRVIVIDDRRPVFSDLLGIAGPSAAEYLHRLVGL